MNILLLKISNIWLRHAATILPITITLISYLVHLYWTIAFSFLRIDIFSVVVFFFRRTNSFSVFRLFCCCSLSQLCEHIRAPLVSIQGCSAGRRSRLGALSASCPDGTRWYDPAGECRTQTWSVCSFAQSSVQRSRCTSCEVHLLRKQTQCIIIWKVGLHLRSNYWQFRVKFKSCALNNCLATHSWKYRGLDIKFWEQLHGTDKSNQSMK